LQLRRSAIAHIQSHSQKWRDFPRLIASNKFEDGTEKSMMKKLLAVFTILVAVFAAVSVIALSTTAQPTVVGKVYTMDNAASNNIWQFNRMSDGTLNASGVFTTGGNGTGAKLDSQGSIALSKDGKWLFAVDAASNEISVFQVNSTGLNWTAKVNSMGVAPISLTVNGNWLYVLNNGSATKAGNIAGFQLTSTGNLSYIAGSNQSLSGMMNSSPEQIGFNPQGTMLVVTEKASNVTDIYTVSALGMASAPSVMASVGNGPFGFAFTEDGFLIMSEAASNTMSSFAWTPNGSLRTISGALPTFQMAPCWVAVTSNGQWAFTTNAASGTISTYAVANNGILLLTSSIAAKIASPALDLALSGDNGFLYALNGNNLTGFKIYPDDGGLWQVTNVPNLPPAATGLAAT
jgi:6-phosphogluconolactonase